MLNPDATRLAVWGDPIAHSRSPALHAAAYRALGVPWTYGRRRVDASGFAAALAERDATWRGLSLTYPLKAAAFTASERLDRRAELTGAVNTLLLCRGSAEGVNTDVGGIVRALAEQGIVEAPVARLVGAGATATSALVALAELGAREVEVVARRPGPVDGLRRIGAALGISVISRGFTDGPAFPVAVTIGTLPGDTPLEPSVADALARSGGLLMDVVYGHWPTALAAAWQRSGHPVTDGLGMLLHQALLQVRVFAVGDVERELPGEDAVLAEMRAAIMGD